MRSSVSIVLFFLLSGLFLAALLGAVERSRKLLGVAGACVVVLTCVIVFVKPVQLLSLSDLRHGTTTTSTTVRPAAVAPTTTPTAGTGSSAAPPG